MAYSKKGSHASGKMKGKPSKGGYKAYGAIKKGKSTKYSGAV